MTERGGASRGSISRVTAGALSLPTDAIVRPMTHTVQVSHRQRNHERKVDPYLPFTSITFPVALAAEVPTASIVTTASLETVRGASDAEEETSRTRVQSLPGRDCDLSVTQLLHPLLPTAVRPSAMNPCHRY